MTELRSGCPRFMPQAMPQRGWSNPLWFQWPCFKLPAHAWPTWQSVAGEPRPIKLAKMVQKRRATYRSDTGDDGRGGDSGLPTPPVRPFDRHPHERPPKRTLARPVSRLTRMPVRSKPPASTSAKASTALSSTPCSWLHRPRSTAPSNNRSDASCIPTTARPLPKCTITTTLSHPSSPPCSPSAHPAMPTSDSPTPDAGPEPSLRRPGLAPPGWCRYPVFTDLPRPGGPARVRCGS